VVTFTKMNTFTVYQFLHFLTDVLYVVLWPSQYILGKLLVLWWENPVIAMALCMGCVVAFVVTCVRVFMWAMQWVKKFIAEQVFNRFAKLVAQNILDEQIKPKKK
jgi:hypothetical protein